MVGASRVCRCRFGALVTIGIVATACASTRNEAQGLTGIWHHATSHDTLSQLAERYRIPIEDLEELNGIDRGETIATGTSLFIPKGSTQPGDRAPPSTTIATSSTTGTKGKRASRDYVWPVPGGTLSSTFGVRDGRPHEGIDISAPRGTPILAAARGTVIYEGQGIRGYGNLIIIRHDGNRVTVYAHNHRNRVKKGDVVEQGQVIGEVGNTGRTTGPHLHFEIRNGEEPIDPEPLLQR